MSGKLQIADKSKGTNQRGRESELKQRFVGFDYKPIMEKKGDILRFRKKQRGQAE
jgi:hypothetical protein